ncbi:MAG: DUF4115 domain-containing protein [Rhodobacteraceae bacterium]|nr:DUF4115 domain-containing protein [Paracoccaceae bacterium]
MIGRWRTPVEEETPEPRGFDDFELRLGDLMRGERATLGKSLLDVQRELKIKAPYIAAIENADPTAFETPGFIAGYVRSYARYLGMDPEWAYESFCAEAGFTVAHGLSAEASSNKSLRREYSGDPLANPNASFVPQGESVLANIEIGAVGSVAALLALIGVIGFGGYSVLREIQQVDFAPVEQSAGVLSDLEDFSGANTDIAVVTGGAGLNTPPSVEAMDRLYRPQALDVPVLVARDGPISTLDPSEVGVLADAGPSPLAPALNSLTSSETGLNEATIETVASSGSGTVQVFGADAPEVMIFAVRPAWVRVQAADGSVIFEKILDAGEQYVLPGTEMPPVLRSGNAGSVYFAVNGTAYGPAGVGPSVVKNIELSSEALAENYQPADPNADDALATFVAEARLGQ